MTREEVQDKMFWPGTLEEIEDAKRALGAYMAEHPDDYDLLQEAESLYMLEMMMRGCWEDTPTQETPQAKEPATPTSTR